MTERLRFAPDVLKRLGEELNPSPEQGILELVRNAYDADAKTCTVKLQAVSQPGGVLTINDDGQGMTPAQLRDSWLVLGSSTKSISERTERFDRLQVGSKGLGRLAALRLGTNAELRSRPKSEPGREYSVRFEWDRFDQVRTVDRVALEILDSTTRRKPGTSIEVTELKRAFTKSDVKRLARAMLLLSSPFESGAGFRPRLQAPEYRELEKLVRHGYWDQAAYSLRAQIGPDGRARGILTDSERDERVTEADHGDLWRGETDGTYEAPPAVFELWVFPLSSSGISTRARTSGISLGAIRDWLAVVGGVHLYHRGLRVYPYGDPGHDWLDMNLMRVASPEERPSTNNSVGRVVVLDEHAQLRQKTDRTGFIETPAFEDLRRFTQDSLDWAARFRVKEAEERRRRERRKARESLSEAQTRLTAAIASAPPEARKTLEKADREVRRATTREVGSLVGDLELYRTLATIGTTTAVMAHEAFNPPNTIIKLARSVRRRAKRLLGGRYEELSEPVDLIESNARRLAAVVDLPRRLLDRGKRRRGTFAVNTVIGDTIELLQPLLDDHRVEVERDFDFGRPKFVGTVAAMESVITNLILNSVSALDRAKAGKPRLVRVETAVEDGRVLVTVSDTGPGIRSISVEDIWLPGRGTTNRGVGLGLTIVRDIVSDFGGTATAMAQGDLGGAEFTINIPEAGS